MHLAHRGSSYIKR